MASRIRAHLGDQLAEALPEQALLHELLGVGVDGDLFAKVLEPSEASQEIRHVVDGAVAKRPHDRLDVFRKIPVRSRQMERALLAVADVQRKGLAAVGPPQSRRGEAAPDLREDVEHVLAGAEAVLAEVWTGAVGLTGLRAAQRHPMAPSRGRARHHVVRPGTLRIERVDLQPLRRCPFAPLVDRSANEFLLVQPLERHAVARRRREPEGELLLEDEGQGRTRVHAGPGARAATADQPELAPGRELDRDARLGKLERESIRVEPHLLIEPDLLRPSRAEELPRARPEQPARLRVREV